MSPKQTRRIAKIIAVVVALAMLVTSFTYIVYADSTEEHIDWDEEFNHLKSLIYDIKANYKDDITYEELLEGTYKGIFDKLNDPYSVYYELNSESDAFIESVSGEFSGIGVKLVESNGRCMIESPVADSPAEKAGLQAGDFIVKVDGINVVGMHLDDIVNLIRGETGTKVTLTIERDGRTHTVSIIRDVIKLTSVSYKLLEDNIGYIRIAQMDSDSHLEFKNAKLRLIAQGAKSFIIDLRNNAGGYTHVAINIADQLMPKGPITHFEQKGEIKESVYSTGQGDLG
ncbi:MAG: PDZ domain-containing protein, partial [Clostridiales bacterium]|nr:PDZ domain-containing protein [Clostridiales bacterium]